ncbi:hypothetical protein EDC01DRAFT_632893 [Geopyxis carbonaria]|nr:hypothetical protein EDC01DRAFT_632893 [Geopyxis carbonaria]
MRPSDLDQLTLSQLEEFDDLLTDSLVDRIYYWATIRKVKHVYHANRGVKTNAIVNIVVEDVVRKKSVAKALERFFDLPGIKTFVKKQCKSEHLKNDFNKHSRRYLSIYLPDSSFEVSTTHRYSLTENEACILARRQIKRGETVRYLTGVMFKISPEEEANYIERQNDFSIIHSSRAGGTSILLGPARFVNHDCNPNAKFVTSNKENVQIVVVRDIEIGQEITVSYADGYFGINNQDCLCQSCENTGKNGWAPDTQNMKAHDGFKNHEAFNMMRTRSKRKGVVDGSLEQLLPSKRAKRKSNKLEVMTPPDSDRAVSEDIGTNTLTMEAKTLPEPKAMPSTPILSTVNLLGLSTPHKTGETTPVADPALVISAEDTEVGDIAESLLALAQSPGFHRPLRSPLVEIRSVDGDIAGFGTPLGIRNTNLDEDLSRLSTVALPIMETVHKEATNGNGGISKVVENDNDNHHVVLEDGVIAPDMNGTSQGEFAISNTNISNDSDSELSMMSETAFDELDKSVNDLPNCDQEKLKNNVSQSLKSSVSLMSVRRRTPGDYLRAPDKDSRLCICLDCGENFIHRDTWYIPRSCQRCERHSKIYGLGWPKTVKRKGDIEDIIDDPRKVQRYVTANEHRKELKRLQQQQDENSRKKKGGVSFPASTIR